MKLLRDWTLLEKREKALLMLLAAEQRGGLGQAASESRQNARDRDRDSERHLRGVAWWDQPGLWAQTSKNLVAPVEPGNSLLSPHH